MSTRLLKQTRLDIKANAYEAALKKLEEIYVGDIDEKKMINSALEGDVAALGDEYTEYLTEEEAFVHNVSGFIVAHLIGQTKD